ncbi:MAG TPA: acyl carrier protein [Geobacteraceae bacterium]|nr:acyl carrier protein [Geobacteraceae bacterium]
MDTIQIIKNFVVSELCSGNMNLEDADLLIEEGIIDSYGIMTLINFLENKFSIEISGDELVPENFASLATISLLVNRKIGIQGEA